MVVDHFGLVGKQGVDMPKLLMCIINSLPLSRFPILGYMASFRLALPPAVGMKK